MIEVGLQIDCGLLYNESMSPWPDPNINKYMQVYLTELGPFDSTRGPRNSQILKLKPKTP